MIVKMKFINISGPRNDIDRVTDQYLSRYEIQLESALSELKTVDNLRPFVELNPYREVLSKANEFVRIRNSVLTICLSLYARRMKIIVHFRKKRKSLSRKLKNTGRNSRS